MSMNFYNGSAKVINESQSSSSYSEGLRKYMTLVYANMFKALIVSALVAYFTSLSGTLMKAIFGTPLQYVIMFAPIVVVLVFAFKIGSMSYETARNVFYGYAALMGLSLSYMLLAYTGVSIVRTFVITAATFGAMSLYGYTTKKDLTSFGSFLLMGLIGILIASLVNIFLKSSALAFVVSIIGVIVFVGLAAYDTQKIKEMYYACDGMDIASAKKVALMGSLTLYIDFINLFVTLLRFFGDRRE